MGIDAWGKMDGFGIIRIRGNALHGDGNSF